MALYARPTSPLTRRKVLFGIGRAASASTIAPALALTSPGEGPIGSEKRVSQAELDRIVTLHQSWLDQRSDGAFANLAGRDLTGLNFGRSDLSHVNFAGANLSHIHATETRFCYGNFTAANLSAMQSIDCDFRASHFKRATLVNATS